MVIPVGEADRVVEFVVLESFKAVEESIGIVWVIIVATPAVIVDNGDIEVGFKVLGIAFVTNVIFSKELTERIKLAENVFEVVMVVVLAVRTDSTSMIVFIVC